MAIARMTTIFDSPSGARRVTDWESSNLALPVHIDVADMSCWMADMPLTNVQAIMDIEIANLGRLDMYYATSVQPVADFIRRHTREQQKSFRLIFIQTGV